MNNNFQDKLPVAIPIGEDVAKKTFRFSQLSRIQSCKNLLMFLLMDGQNLEGKFKNILEQARQNVNNTLNLNFQISISDFKDRITQSLSNQSWNEVNWANFWVKEFSRALGFNQENYQLNELDKYLKQKNSKIIILIDGLENIFPDLAHDNFQQTALKALIDNLPNKLTEIKQSNLGLIVFLHRDSLRKTIKQNSGQFESLYIEYCF